MWCLCHEVHMPKYHFLCVTKYSQLRLFCTLFSLNLIELLLSFRHSLPNLLVFSKLRFVGCPVMERRAQALF